MNALKSTGPRSDEGKAVSRQNALKHGVLSENVATEREDPKKYDALLNHLLAEHEPETATETLLVERLANLFWRERRLAYAEKLALKHEEDRARAFPDVAIDPCLAFEDQLLIGRYQTMLTNQIFVTLRELRTEKDRRARTIESDQNSAQVE